MTRAHIEVGTVTAIIGTIFTYLFGAADKVLLALFFFIAVDYLTGLMAAWYNGRLNSQKGFKGIIKKVMMLIVVVVANQLDTVFNSDIARTMTILFFIGNEGLSISENAQAVGLPVPWFLKDKLEQLKNQKEVKGNAITKENSYN